MRDTILVTGASGQIGTELVMNLREIYGNDHVIASDLTKPSKEIQETGPFEELNVLDGQKLHAISSKYNVTQIYHLVAMLSATAEKVPEKGWDLNMTSLFHVLNMAKDNVIKKVYWPSSIAVFGPTTPRVNTPQLTVMEPNTVYGISKQAGERWCEYYFNKYNVDVRSIRYPGLISWKNEPGGGTTDYAVDIFYEALRNGKYTSFLSEDMDLPMMYMPDAIRGTIQLMESESEKIKIRSSYNMGALSFDPKTLANAIKKEIPDFEIDYAPDFRQAIAKSWPGSINDQEARAQWGWKHNFELEDMVMDMLTNLRTKLKL